MNESFLLTHEGKPGRVVVSSLLSCIHLRETVNRLKKRALNGRNPSQCIYNNLMLCRQLAPVINWFVMKYTIVKIENLMKQGYTVPCIRFFLEAPENTLSTVGINTLLVWGAENRFTQKPKDNSATTRGGSFSFFPLSRNRFLVSATCSWCRSSSKKDRRTRSDCL